MDDDYPNNSPFDFAPNSMDSLEMQKKVFAQRIDFLQNQQYALMQQNALQLEELKKEMENQLDPNPLLQEIERLKDIIAEKEFQQANQEKILRAQIGELDEKLRLFSYEFNNQVGSLFEHLDHQAAPTILEKPKSKRRFLFFRSKPKKNLEIENSTKKEKSKPVETKKKLDPEPKPLKEKKKKLGFGKRTLRAGLSLALIMAIGWLGLNKWQSYRKTSAGQVAGVSTDPTITNPTPTPQTATDQYSQSYAEIPFAQTVWTHTNNPVFGISMDYPQNTTNLVTVVGGSNIWFLRKNGYLIQLSRIDTPLSLDQWWSQNKANYSDGYIYSRGNFKNFPAMVGVPIVRNDLSGTQYFVQNGSSIFQIWIKDETPTSDDGQRLARMISSLQFTNNQ
jgi:hypothetical protein